MYTKSFTSILAGSVLMLGMTFGGNAHAGPTTTCPSNLDNKVTPNLGCEYSDSKQDFLNGDTLTVNNDKFFGIENWEFAGRYNLPGSDTSPLFNFTGNGQSGTFTWTGGEFTSGEVMLIFKNGGKTSLVGYRIDMATLLDDLNGDGVYNSPFENPPFSGLKNGQIADISHISVYISGLTTEIELPPIPPVGIPEPTSIALMGLGLAMLGFGLRRRRQF